MDFGLNKGMDAPLASRRYGPDYTPKMVSAIAACSAAITRLDARVSASSVAAAWSRRAAWSGYTRALQLQGGEIDEIDVFSWGSGLHVPGRARRATHLDHFADFAQWHAALGETDPLAWRDRLPTAIGEPAEAPEHPALIRALDRVRQHARIDGGLAPWLGLPFALRDLKLSSTPLPCLAGGMKAFRLKKTLADADWYSVIRSVEASADTALTRLDRLERYYRDAQRALAAQYRAGALPRLLALMHHQPLLSPQGVADTLGLSVAGASKLLERTKDAGLLVEITERRSWRQFLTPDLAEDFGYVRPQRGRPSREPPPLPASPALAQVFDAFDSEMAAIDGLLTGRRSRLERVERP
jgi:hypothetical protein